MRERTVKHEFLLATAYCTCAVFAAGCSSVPRDTEVGAPIPLFSIIEAANCLPFDFSGTEHNAIPPGFVRGRDQTYLLGLDAEETALAGEPVLCIRMQEAGNAFLDTKPFSLKPGHRYVLIVPFRIQNLRLAADDKPGTKGVLFYAYATHRDRHRAIRLASEGGTPGWTTAILPFDTIHDPELTHLRILLRGYRVTGTLWLKAPAVVAVPVTTELRPHFILGDGTVLHDGGVLLGRQQHTEGK